PPFSATAPTVLGQVFRLLEADYHGDGLCCLLDFLIPAKRLFEHVRQAACAPYCNCLFLHEGWPLCLHEKVVIHLAPLNLLLLRPGDFYLQAEPCQDQAAGIVLKCLSRDLRAVEEIPVPQPSYSLLFTNEWLEEVNRGLDRAPLRTCLVATENGVMPMPWSKIATPEFIEKPKVAPSLAQAAAAPLTAARDRGSLECPGAAAAPVPGSGGHAAGTVRERKAVPPSKYPGLIKVEQAGPWEPGARGSVAPSLCDVLSGDLEGEYVDLLELSADGGSGVPPGSEQPAPPGEAEPSSESEPGLLRANGRPAAEKWACGRGPSAGEGPCTPCLRRRRSRDPQCPGPRCWYRESYAAAVQSPIGCGAGPMAAIQEECEGPSHDPPPAVKPPDGHRSPRSGCPPRAASQEAKAEEATTQGYLKLRKSPAGAGRNPSRSEPPAASHKFPFSKGPRQPAAPAETSAGRHGGSRRMMSVLYSPRMSRAKPAGKGNKGAGVTLRSRDKRAQGKGAVGRSHDAGTWLWWFETGLGGVAGQRPTVCSPPAAGSTDKLGRALIQVSTSSRAWEASWCSAREVARLLLYLCSIPRRKARGLGLTVVVDARRQPPSPALNACPAWQCCPHRALQLSPFGCPPQVEALASLDDLGRYVDPSQLTRDLDGTFPYCHSEWVPFFQKLHPFVADLTAVSELLRRAIGELERGASPEGLQEATERTERYRELMRTVLRDPQLVTLQRDAGATLARLSKEATRLSSSPDVRSHMDAALGLYNRVEEEVHTLVAKSNQCLERLEHVQKIRELEAEFGKVRAGVAGAVGGPQALARYNQGLVLCKEAAGFAGPEAEALEAARGDFQARLTSFYADVERQQAELETLLNLYRFYDKVNMLRPRPHGHDQGDGAGWENKELLSIRSRAGSPKAVRRLAGSLQKLSAEFPAPRLQAMKAQACALRHCWGLGLWHKAWGRYRETRQALAEMLAPSDPDPAPPAHEQQGAAAAGSKRCEAESGGADDAPPDPCTGPSHVQQPQGCSPEGVLGAALPGAGALARDAPTQEPPLTCCSDTGQRLEGSASHPVRDGRRAGKRPEAAQYFQVSRHSSFSSEDTDSQHSAEDLPAASAALSRDPSPRLACPQGESAGILYLEKPHANSPAQAGAE
uniref:KIAA1755 n=1 Tax=Crocodylus porosus TaxID=8502 RepID=A0A7M4EKT7_CROPO